MSVRPVVEAPETRDGYCEKFDLATARQCSPIECSRVVARCRKESSVNGRPGDQQSQGRKSSMCEVHHPHHIAHEDQTVSRQCSLLPGWFFVDSDEWQG